jgi:hypothetical protein
LNNIAQQFTLDRGTNSWSETINTTGQVDINDRWTVVLGAGLKITGITFTFLGGISNNRFVVDDFGANTFVNENFGASDNFNSGPISIAGATNLGVQVLGGVTAGSPWTATFQVAAAGLTGISAPGTLLLLGSGLVGVGRMTWKKRSTTTQRGPAGSLVKFRLRSMK